MDAQAGAGVTLGVDVDQQDGLAAGRQGRAQVDRRRGLANPAFLIGDRDDAAKLRGLRIDDDAHGGYLAAGEPSPSPRTGSGKSRLPYARLLAPRSIHARRTVLQEKADADVRNRSARTSRRGKGASARAVMTSAGHPASARCAPHGPDRCARFPCHLAQELALASIALDQIHPAHPRIASTMPGNPAPLPRSTTVPRRRGCARKLGTIEEMAPPGVDERRAADEIDRLLPAAQQLR